MNDCVFCRIISGELPCLKIYEDDSVFAFIDAADDVDGHTLVLPKKHCAKVTDCEDDYLSKVIKAVKKIAAHYVDDCGFDGVNILNASGEAAQQTVHHLHFHIIPRCFGDGFVIRPNFPGCKNDRELMHQKLKML